MAAGFSITITAVDAASARIDAINKRLAAFNAPVERLQKSLGKFSQLSGMKAVGEGFERMSRAAYGAFQSVSRIVAPLAGITSAASVAGMYKLVEAWGQWGSQLGFTSQRIGITAGDLQTLQGAALLAGSSAGAASTGLQALGQSMYDAIGGRAPETVALFNQLGIAFQDGTRHARSVTDVLPEIADRIASIKDPYTQARIAAQLFGGAAESLLPFLRRGSAGIAAYEEKARRYGVTSAGAVEAANRMREAQANLTLAVQGLGNSIAEQLAPVISPLLGQMADWIAANRAWIASDIGKYVRQFAAYLKSVDWNRVGTDIEGIATSANNVAQHFGGWQNALEGVIALKIAAWLSPFAVGLFAVGRGITAITLATPQLTAALVAITAVYEAYKRTTAAYNEYQDRVSLGEKEKEAKKDLDARVDALSPEKRKQYDDIQARKAHFTQDDYSSSLDKQKHAANLPTAVGRSGAQNRALAYFQSQGWTQAQAAGIAANINSESGYKPTAVGDGGQAYGLGQWHEDRQKNFAKWAGHDIHKSTYDEQLGFYNYELTEGEERKAGNRLRSATTPYQAGAIVSQYDERPAAVQEAANNRGNMANQINATAPALAFADGKTARQAHQERPALMARSTWASRSAAAARSSRLPPARKAM